MMRTLKSNPGRLAVTIWLVFAAGCGARQVDLSTLPADDLYAGAMEAYENRNWGRAIEMFEFFVAQYLGDPRAPDARMLLGDIHMEREEYPTAATHYQRFAIDFPADPRALTARFNICEAYYRLSPRPALDQEFTVSALAHCQSVAENYAGTTEAQEAVAHIDELRWKLAKKVYDTGMFYFRRRAYDSAVVYFQDVVEQYPRTDLAPAALSQLAETYDRIGYVEDAAEARERLQQEYPESAEALANGA